MMDDSEGTGDGEWGKLICVIGTWPDGSACGGQVVAVAAVEGADSVAAGAGAVDEAPGAIVGGSCGRPPNPGKPRVGCCVRFPDGTPSMAETRSARSPIWRCMPRMAVVSASSALVDTVVAVGSGGEGEIKAAEVDSGAVADTSTEVWSAAAEEPGSDMIPGCYGLGSVERIDGRWEAGA